MTVYSFQTSPDARFEVFAAPMVEEEFILRIGIAQWYSAGIMAG
jgi:hypothetical protein